MTRALPTLSDEEVTRGRAADEEAGFGALTTALGPLPLKALDVRARIDGLLARVDLTQTFVNTHDQPLEATYIFPLPDRAAVTRFRLEVAGRVLNGELKERGQARQDYDEALKAGHRAAITEEERPGVFTLRVGNLPPGETAVVLLTLAGPLPYSDGEATFRFPLVVAPRYIPGTPLPGPSVGDGVTVDTDTVPDASRISPPVLLPSFPNPVRLSLAVEFPGAALAPYDLRSSLHAVREEEAGRTRRVILHPGERLNRDFILRFRLGGKQVETALDLQPDGDGLEGTFALTLVPPVSRGTDRPRDVVFVLDRSGSMQGWKMVAARRALARMVETLTEADRFTVLAFDNAVESPPEFGVCQLVPADDRRRFQAVEFLGKVDSRGGTEMARPLDLAVTELNRQTGRGERDAQRILVLVTDGQVGNEDQILRQLGAAVKDIRIFTLGIDRAVNAAFLKRLADLGGGSSEVVESEKRLDEVMDLVHRHIGTPVLTDLHLEPAGLKFVPDSLVPTRLPALFAGTPLVVLGRYRGAAEGGLTLQARDASGQEWDAQVMGHVEEGGPLPSVWARGRLRELEDRYVIGGGKKSLEKEIVATSLRFGALCRFTAFVVVDRSEVVNPGGQVHSLVQPVEQPEGWGKGAFASAMAAPGSGLTCTGAMPGSMKDMLARVRAPQSRVQEELTCGGPSVSESLELAHAQPVRARGKGRGIIERLLDLFRSPRKETALDRQVFRARVLAALERLQKGSGGEAGALWQSLRSQTPNLRKLFKDLVKAGDRHDSVQKLGELLARMEAWPAAATHPGAEVYDLQARLLAVLQEYLALIDGPSASPAPAREGFWK